MLYIFSKFVNVWKSDVINTIKDGYQIFFLTSDFSDHSITCDFAKTTRTFRHYIQMSVGLNLCLINEFVLFLFTR